MRESSAFLEVVTVGGGEGQAVEPFELFDLLES
jgi:hypothetical protein